MKNASQKSPKSDREKSFSRRFRDHNFAIFVKTDHIFDELMTRMMTNANKKSPKSDREKSFSRSCG